ncbi:MAG: TMEM165/GDT1 family protein [Planctomycetia bacterium]|jgi:putative Ca2+/H+ antiporter (TMEM165/GDT1 family)
MDWKVFATVAGTVFLAEIGDKTQLATMTFAAQGADKWSTFLGASLGLVASAGVGVLAGTVLSRWIEPVVLTRIAGVAFVCIGAWTLWKSWS